MSSRCRPRRDAALRPGNARTRALNEPVWVNLAAVLTFHDESLLEFGGSSGIRNRGAIESALRRPKNLFA
jgi:hypothetical protein